jgi:hypothetical protein
LRGVCFTLNQGTIEYRGEERDPGKGKAKRKEAKGREKRKKKGRRRGEEGEKEGSGKTAKCKMKPVVWEKETFRIEKGRQKIAAFSQ